MGLNWVRRGTTYVALCAAAQLLASCSGEPAVGNAAAPTAQPSAAAPAEAADARLVVAFGDSLYAGYGVLQQQSFPSVLERTLKEQGIAATVRNAGVSGDTTQAGAQRLAFTLDGLPRKPDLVVLGLGGNDMLRGLDPAETDRNLRTMLDELKRRDIPVLLTGMVAAPNMGPDYQRRFDAIYPALAKDYDAPLYPFFLDGVIGDRALMLDDSIHPNPDGIERVTARVAPLVAEALKGAVGGG
ncbi:arylesterase [Sphingomonas sp. CJ99]